MSSAGQGQAYNGRRAPNVSQYLQNLNTISSGHDLPSDINLGEGDLDFLTNAEFFDFETSTFNPNVDAFHARSPHDDEAPPKGRRVAVSGTQGGQQFGEFQTYPYPVGSSPAGLHGQYPPQPAHQLPFTAAPQSGDKRKASISTSLASPADFEEQSRMAAEEDKRRRNTAASARFRVKKKQREQALEKQAKDMADKVQALEGRVQQLQMENKWLKGLITDKNGGQTVGPMPKEKEVDDRKVDEHTTGVGTPVDAEDKLEDESEL